MCTIDRAKETSNRRAQLSSVQHNLRPVLNQGVLPTLTLHLFLTMWRPLYPCLIFQISKHLKESLSSKSEPSFYWCLLFEQRSQLKNILTASSRATFMTIIIWFGVFTLGLTGISKHVSHILWADMRSHAPCSKVMHGDWSPDWRSLGLPLTWLHQSSWNQILCWEWTLWAVCSWKCPSWV